MKPAWCTIVLALLAVSSWQQACADELVIPFVRGLRARGFYDTANEYLDRVAKDPQVSAEIRKRIPYERAVTLTDEAFAGKNAELQLRLLDRAAAELEKFIRDNAGHPLLGNAKTRRGRIFLGKARAYAQQANSPANAADRDKFRALAQSSIDTARKVFQSARDEHEKRWKTFPVSTPDPAVKQQREGAEKDFIEAQLDLAKTTHEEAQLHPKGSAKLQELLTKASKQYEAIHTRYRTQLGGLLARVYQGKCFEEQDRIGAALGIYGEFLDHRSKSPAMINLQNQVLHFKLICLNHDQRKDYQLVIDEATEWLNKNRRRARTPVGLGIRYELAVAREKLANDREKLAKLPGPPAQNRERLLRDAQDDAQFLNAFPGKYKDATTMMISRIKRARGLKTKDPDTFADAFSTANVTFSNVKSAQKALDQAKAGGKPKTEIDDLAGKLKDQIGEAARLYRLTLKLATPKDKPEHVNAARQVLAFLYYRQAELYGKNDLLYDAAVLAEFVARNFKKESPDVARKSAYLAMACYSRIHSLARGSDRDTEMQWIIRSALYITDNWPGSKLAIEANIQLGRIYDRQNRPLLAARWYARVPSSARDQYSNALLRTGQSYWAHYLAVAAQEPTKNNQLAALRESVGGEWAVAVADLLNPSWSDWQRLVKQQELNAKLAAGPARKAEEQDDQQPAPKAKKKTKQKQKQKQKKKKAAAKNASPASKPVADALAKSTAELRTALAALTKLPAEQFRSKSHDELRSQLVATLRKQSPSELEKRFDKRLNELPDAELKATLQRKIDLWQVLAAWYLKTGIDRLQSETPADAASPEDLIAGKTSLAQYLIGIGEYQRVIDLLNNDPHSVVAAVKVADESKRPADRGITSRTFAGLVYQLLARAYIGVRKLDDFRKAMDSLKTIAGGEDKENITRIYEQLGRDQQREFERLKNQGQDKRLKEEQENFKWIVDELFKNQDALKYNSLIWIAETSYGMGEGLGDDPLAVDYFERAAKAYKLILDSDKIDKDQRLGVRLRLANCTRRQKEPARALEIAESVIKENPRFLRAQIEAVLALQSWGASGQSDKFVLAINGDEKKNVWGWAGITSRIQQSPDFPRTADRSRWSAQQMDYKQKYLQAQYYTSWCRMQHGIGQSASKTDPKRVQVLSNAMRQLIAFSSACGVIDGLTFIDESARKPVDAKKKFDELFRDVQLEMGKSQTELVTLTWPEPAPEADPPAGPEKKQPAVAAKQAGDTQAQPTRVSDEKKDAASSSSLPMIFGLLFLLAGLGAGGWMMFKMMGKGRRPRPAYSSYTSGANPFAPPGGNSAPSAAARPRASSKPAAGTKPSPAQRPAGAAAPAKRRTPPPAPPTTKKPG